MDQEDFREGLRRLYRPSRVKLMLVALAPPDSGRFFYKEDSNLFGCTRLAFDRVYTWRYPPGFLQFFRGLGCYLDDLFLEPLWQAKHEQWQRFLAELPTKGSAQMDWQLPKGGKDHLAARIHELQPQVVLPIYGRIESIVHQAALAGGVPEGRVLPSLVFPVWPRWEEYIDGLEGVLRRLIAEGILAQPMK